MAYRDEKGKWQPNTPNHWTREEIDWILLNDPVAVEVGIKKLYTLQTHDEQQSLDTKHDNGVGFSQSNSRRGTRYAEWVLKSTNPPGCRLFGAGLEKARQVCLTHSKQLTEIANGQLSLS